MQMVRDMDLVGEHAVDPVAHDNALGPRLDMDVGGTQADGFENDRIGQPDGRWRLGVAQQVFELGGVVFLDDDLDAFVGVGRTDQGFQFLEVDLAAAVDFIDLLADGRHVGGHGIDVEAGRKADFIDQPFVERVGHGQQQAAPVELERDDALAHAETARDQIGQRGIDLEFRQLHFLDHHVGFQEFPDSAFGNPVVLEQQRDQGLLAPFLLQGQFL